jgi:hypothetical protein
MFLGLTQDQQNEWIANWTPKIPKRPKLYHYLALFSIARNSVFECETNPNGLRLN